LSCESACASAFCAACRHPCNMDVSMITASIGGGCSCGAVGRSAATAAGDGACGL
jgi:hypothetical protein